MPKKVKVKARATGTILAGGKKCAKLAQPAGPKHRGVRNEPLWWLEAGRHTRLTRWQVDQDYLDKLTPRELSWLNEFNREYVNGSSKRGRGKLHGKSLRLTRDCFQRKNVANRDIFARAQAMNRLTPLNADSAIHPNERVEATLNAGGSRATPPTKKKPTI